MRLAFSITVCRLVPPGSLVGVLRAARVEALGAALEFDGPAARSLGLNAALAALNRRLLRPGTLGRGAGRLGAPGGGVRPLGAEVLVELNSESCTRRPASRAWAIIRRARRAHHHSSDREHRVQRRQAGRTSHSDRASRSHRAQEGEMAADVR